MGAVFGIYGEANESELSDMGTRLAHRGRFCAIWEPDRGVHFGLRYIKEGSASEGRPIVFDGLIDNRKDLLRLLKIDQGTDIDYNELVFRLYEMYGPQGFVHISGQFAAAVWDRSRRKLVLACDAWNIKPLYYAIEKERCVFASEYKALLAIRSLPAEADPDALQYQQCTKYSMPGSSSIKNVRSIIGGCWVEVSREGQTVHRYMNLSVEVRKKSSLRHILFLRGAFLETVRRQTEGLDALGVALSGGLDSAVLVAALRNVRPEAIIHTFTAGYSEEDRAFKQAEEISKAFKTIHHQDVFPMDGFKEILVHTLWHMEEPVGREEKLFYRVTAESASKHVHVIFAGHNADALFGGMPRHMVAYLAMKNRLLRRSLTDLYNYTQIGEVPKAVVGRVLAGMYDRGLSPNPIRLKGSSFIPSPVAFSSGSRQPFNEYLASSLMFGPNANSAIEKIHAGSGIQILSPFLDTNFINAAFRVPDNFKIRGLRQKSILRKILGGILPAKAGRARKGLLRLDHDISFCELIENLSASLELERSLSQRGFFDVGVISRLVARPRNGIYGGSHLYTVWFLILLELWSRIFLDYRGDARSLEAVIP